MAAKIQRTGHQKKALESYKKDMDQCSLTQTQFKKLSVYDKKEYLSNVLSKKRGDRGRDYGYYNCYECAKADVFETRGYISED
jgi:hypothetical protein